MISHFKSLPKLLFSKHREDQISLLVRNAIFILRFFFFFFFSQILIKKLFSMAIKILQKVTFNSMYMIIPLHTLYVLAF